MYRLLCKEEEITRGQRKMLDIVDSRKMAALCRDYGLSFNFTYKIAIGGNIPPSRLIFTLRNLIHPALWFYTEQEKEPELRQYEPTADTWNYRESIAFRQLSEIADLKNWCIEHHNPHYTSLWLIATGKREPSYQKIKELRDIIYPADWFYAKNLF